MTARPFTHDEHRQIRELLSQPRSDKHLEHKLTHIESEMSRIVMLGAQLEKDLAMSNAKLDALQADVAADKDVISSCKTLLAGIDGMIAAAVTAARMDDNAQVDQIRADLKTQIDGLSAAVAANTKADPTPAVAASAPPTVAPPVTAPTPADPSVTPTVSSAAGASTGGSTV